MNPFDFVNDLSFAKKDLISNSDNPEDMEKAYNPFLINKAFSHFIDTILLANEMNKASLDNKLQHDYYLHAMRPKKRFSKWHKTEPDETLILIAEAYNINIVRAREYLALMSQDDIIMLKEIRNQGGRENEK